MNTFNLREYDKQANKKSLIELSERYKEVQAEIKSHELKQSENMDYLLHERDYLKRTLTANNDLLNKEREEALRMKGMDKMIYKNDALQYQISQFESYLKNCNHEEKAIVEKHIQELKQLLESESNILKSVTLKNGIDVKLLKSDNGYEVISSVTNYPETCVNLQGATFLYENRVNLYSRFVKATI